jgi:adenosylcobyric acid synthase
VTHSTTPVAALPNKLGWCNASGNVLGIYVHGLFENAAVLQTLFGAQAQTLDAVFDGLASYIDMHFEHGILTLPRSTQRVTKCCRYESNLR